MPVSPSTHPRGGFVVALALALATACSGSPPAPATSSAPTAVVPNATVVRHVDGDTILVRRQGVEQRVRLIGIDTPETKKPNVPVECYGPEASNRLHELVPDGSAVRLERDAEELDDFGRVLAYVYRADDGTFVNQVLAVEGFADVLSIKPNTAHADEIRAAVEQARRERRGLWAACPGPHAAAP